jgi:hypothetical protein
MARRRHKEVGLRGTKNHSRRRLENERDASPTNKRERQGEIVQLSSIFVSKLFPRLNRVTWRAQVCDMDGTQEAREWVGIVVAA